MRNIWDLWRLGRRGKAAAGCECGRWFTVAAMALAATALRPAGAMAGGARLVWYTSPVDGTRQAYGVYVPSRPAPPGGYPAVFHGHGYGWSVSAGFSQWQKRWADDHGWVLVNINARGPTFYEGIGQAAVYEVVNDAAARFGLNRRRLFFIGGSMGGTGAFRQGIRHPEIFAAVVAVDGWGDWRLWHHHWYARTDMRDDIEEFRRPLLSSVAPLYWAERAMWGRIRSVTDGRDTIVWPDNSLRLIKRLAELADGQPGAYRHDIILNYTKGHGGGHDIRRAYDFFLHAAPAGLGRRLRLKVWRLAFARQGWLAITRIRAFGLPAEAESIARGPVISVWTENVERLDVLPAECPDAAARRWCAVYVDGFPVYSGPPRLVSLEAVFDASDRLVGWREAGEDMIGKRPGLEGPIGDAFTQPFIVAYATGGPAADRQQHKKEAEAFCRGWNSFFVHGPGIQPRAEDEIEPSELARKNLVVFGCLDCSRLLRLADRQRRFPVRVYHRRIEVCEADGRRRAYHGEQYGCFVVYPNPLARGRRYVVVCKGRWFTGAEAGEPRGLEYDLEKLPWAYPDYVIFNSDQRELPLVVNVNNKPPVTCYEAAYFAEAGFFDNSWQPAPQTVVRWVKKLRPERARLVHVAAVERSMRWARVKICDDQGAPVGNARVTVAAGKWCHSSVSDPAGWAWFFGPPARPLKVLSVMATGAAYDRAGDCLAAHPLGDSRLAAKYVGSGTADVGQPVVRLAWDVGNVGEGRVELIASVDVPRGIVSPGRVRVALAPGERRRVEFDWQPAWPPAGKTWPRLEMRVVGGGGAGVVASRRLAGAAATVSGPTAIAPAAVEFRGPRIGPVAVREVKASALAGGGWQVTAKVANASSAPQEIELCAFVVQAALPLGRRKAWLDPRSEQSFTWDVPTETARMWSGPADVVVSAVRREGVFGKCQIVLQSREAECFAFAD